jgi:hypothetical protein
MPNQNEKVLDRAIRNLSKSIKSNWNNVLSLSDEKWINKNEFLYGTINNDILENKSWIVATILLRYISNEYYMHVGN